MNRRGFLAALMALPVVAKAGQLIERAKRYVWKTSFVRTDNFSDPPENAPPGEFFFRVYEFRAEKVEDPNGEEDPPHPWSGAVETHGTSNWATWVEVPDTITVLGPKPEDPADE